MMLIVDSGSTSSEWLFVGPSGEVKRYMSPGFNPYYFKDDNYLKDLEKDTSDDVNFSDVKLIYFYGSGCSTDENCTIVKNSLLRFFPHADIHLHHDLYGSAIALFGNNSGIACILGTGSNSCLWDGNEIVENVPSLGYLLADEGSGTYLGKLILTDILLGKAPKELSEQFHQNYDMDFSKALDKMYKEPNPNKFFSSISKFASANISHPWIEEKIKQNFNDFIVEQVSQYTDYKGYEISFIGSVAHSFEAILREVFSANGLNVDRIIKSPTDALLNFHLQNRD